MITDPDATHCLGGDAGEAAVGSAQALLPLLQLALNLQLQLAHLPLKVLPLLQPSHTPINQAVMHVQIRVDQ